MIGSSIKLALFVLFGLLFVIVVSCATTTSMARKHPKMVEPLPLCSDCHTDWRATYNHTTDFAMRHKFLGAQKEQVCSLCHVETFCADCHANKEELKPSDKHKDQPARIMPHRGDYLNQHKIDGKINPASCFPCHGRQNNERCKVCHK